MALLGFGLTHEFLILTGLVVLFGASNNLWHPPAIAYLSEHYPRNRGYALSVHALCANWATRWHLLRQGRYWWYSAGRAPH
ncbi:MAG: hypothetical protein CM1200mP20_12430 [Pseudomonadota bacterium]|nr:MAG: hypothetical protein CM1200mP20_12430 [Pseudomonadota bacterium]